MGGLPSGFWESHFLSALHLCDSMIFTQFFLFKSTNIIVFLHRQTISCVLQVNIYSLPFITLLINPACSAIFWYIWEIFCTLHVRFVVLFYLIFRLLHPDCSAVSCASQVSCLHRVKNLSPFDRSSQRTISVMTPRYQKKIIIHLHCLQWIRYEGWCRIIDANYSNSL